MIEREQITSGSQPYFRQPELISMTGNHEILEHQSQLPVLPPAFPSTDGIKPDLQFKPEKMSVPEHSQDPVQQQMFDGIEEIELGEYEIVRPEFFAHIKEPAFTINVDKICVNAACVRLLPDAEFVQILINRNEKKLVLLPCDETEITGYRWAKTKNGRRYSTQRSGEPFVLTLCRIMDWNPDYRYKILGRLVNSKGKSLIAFDLSSYECFPKRSSDGGTKGAGRRTAFTAGDWDGKFGPKYAESRRSLQVETFNGFTLISIKGKEVEGKMLTDQNSAN